MNHKLIIIIGLPGSGKTNLIQNSIKEHMVFDDFIPDMHQLKFIDALKNNNVKLCLADPRLCIPEMFDNSLSIIQQYIPKEEIQLVVFKNDPEQCIKNKSTLKKTIQKYSKMYNTDYYKEKGYNCLFSNIYL
jgi:predicted ATP-binding protein involved in virulence